jgi:hypothetical protein
MNRQLAVWVHNQRCFYKTKNEKKKKYLKPSQIRELENIGFCWIVPLSSDQNLVTVQSNDEWLHIKDLHNQSLFWECSLVLNVSEEGQQPKLVDICEMFDKENPIKLPKSIFKECNRSTFSEIHKQLFLAARNSGFTIAVQKHYNKDGIVVGIKFRCTNGRQYQKLPHNK